MTAKYLGADLLATAWADRTFGPISEESSGLQTHTRAHVIEAFRAGQTYNYGDPAPIVSHPQYDVKQASKDASITFRKENMHQYCDFAKVYEDAFIAGADWQRGRQPVADDATKPEIDIVGWFEAVRKDIYHMITRQESIDIENRKQAEAFREKVYESLDLIVIDDIPGLFNTLSSALDKQDIALERMELNAQRDAATNQDFNARMLGSIENRLMEMQVRKAFGPDLDNWGNHLHDLIAPISDNVAEILGLMRPEPAELSNGSVEPELTADFDGLFALVESHNLQDCLSDAGLSMLEDWHKSKAKSVQAPKTGWMTGKNNPSPATDESGQGEGFDADHSADALAYMMTGRRVGKSEQQRMETVIRHQREQIGKLHAEISGLHDRERAIARKFGELTSVLDLGYPV